MWTQSPSVRVYRAFDMGFYPDPAVCLWIAHLGNRYIVFKEKLWFRTVASDIAKDIIKESEGMRVSATYCDPSMDFQTGADVRTIKGIFEENGVPMETSVNNREHYAHAVHTALSEEVAPGIPRLQILDGDGKIDGCPYLIKTIPMMQFNEKRPMALADHKHDHAVVALAYFLISIGSYEHRVIKSSTIPRWMHPKTTNASVLGSESVRDRF